MRSATKTHSRKRSNLVRAAARAASIIERLEQRQLLSVSWSIDGSRTLQLTTVGDDNQVRFATFLSDSSNLDLWDKFHNVHWKIPFSDFDRINVQMQPGDSNTVDWVDTNQSSSWAGPMTTPANIDLGSGSSSAMYFFTNGHAALSGDGRSGAVYDHNSSPQSGIVTYKGTVGGSLNGQDGPDYLDGSNFWGNGLGLNGGGGDDTLISGTGNGDVGSAGIGTMYFAGDGNDLIIATSGHVGGYGGAGNDTYIGGPGGGGMNGEEGDDTFIAGTGNQSFDGGPGNDSFYGHATDGIDNIILGSVPPQFEPAGSPTFSVIIVGDLNSNRRGNMSNVENLYFDAGAGIDTATIPTPPPVDIGGPLDPNLHAVITHLEPTVDAGPDITLQNTTSLASSGSFRDIADPANLWTATVDYGDGGGTQPLAYDIGTISTANGPARAFNLNHNYLAPGDYAVTVRVTDSEGDVGTDILHVAVKQTISTLTLTSSTAVYGGDTSLSAALKANGSPLAGRTITFTGSNNSFLGSAVTDSNGVAVLINVSIAGRNAGTYANAFFASFAGDASDSPCSAVCPLTVIDENVQGMVWVDFNNDGNVDFGELGIDGVSVTLTGTDDLGESVSLTAQTGNGGIYTFNHIRPGNYTIAEGATSSSYLEGKDSVGTLGGDASAQDVFSNIPVGINQNGVNYNFGEQPAPGSSVAKGQAATMGFWQNKNGQALILKFDSIGYWLAQTLPQTFGNLAFSSPQDVATLYQQQFMLKDKLDAQAMATALNVYATNASVGGSAAASYGFTVTQYGLGDSTWNVGADGAAFNVANNSTLTVMQILEAWDQQNNKSDKSIRQMALELFGGINSKGGL